MKLIIALALLSGCATSYDECRTAAGSGTLGIYGAFGSRVADEARECLKPRDRSSADA
jgi:hypothetical protein